MSGSWRPPRARITVLALVIIFVGSTIWSYSYQLKNLASYATRPLWDKPDGPSSILPHYHADNLVPTADVCELHSWTARAAEPPVWDAVLFTTELDLLEIRWSELESTVDRFFILENNMTFTGLPKTQDFALNRQRFARFENKIVYKSLAGTIEPHVEPFVVENKHRHAMNRLLRQHLPTDGPRPLVIFSDTDELPSAHTIRLLKACKFPTPLHLRMRTFLYSFEWPYGDTSWRAQVHDWADKISDYSHAMQSNLALADSGWHCTFCFRYIDEFVTKMRGFSHADRVGGSNRLLAPRRIQDVICTGKDIFDMLPEAYTYKDLFALTHLEPSRSMVGLPRFLLESASRFKFLLPGGCVREERPKGTEKQ